MAESLLDTWLHAAEHGAALVYNEAVKIEADVSAWSDAHPGIKPLLETATGYITSMLTAAGLPVPAFVTAGTAALAALKQLAALDPTVDSGH